MKKILSVLLAIIMVVSSSTVIFAADNGNMNNSNKNKSDIVTIGGCDYEVIQNGSDIIVNEYQNDTLISKTTTEINSDIRKIYFTVKT